MKKWDKKALWELVERAIAEIDQEISDQVNAILHHPDVQRLESSWRGLQYLVRCASEEGDRRIKVKVLNCSWREAVKDVQKATEFDQSQLWKKIYEYDFGVAGGDPLGIIVGDYEIHPWPNAEHPEDDIDALTKLSGIAAAAFCPFVTAASPAMFGLDDFKTLETVENLASGFRQKEFIRWERFRERDDSRFIGITLPRVLMRLPYRPEDIDVSFCFEEDVDGPNCDRYLWGNSAYAFAEVAIRAFAQSGWLAGIRGFQRDVISGGVVSNLPKHCFGTDRWGTVPKTSTETVILESDEATFADLGFIPLCSSPENEYSVFYSNQSVQKAKTYDRVQATRNAKLSVMLQYMLCVSRFAHYLKVQVRDMIGTMMEPADCQRRLERWIKEYVTPDDSATVKTKARRPLRSASISVERDPADPGKYFCQFHLQPHYQLDELSGAIKLHTTVE